jgi:acyl carrier protein
VECGFDNCLLSTFGSLSLEPWNPWTLLEFFNLKRRRMVELNDHLIEKMKELIIQRLRLADMTPEMIETDAPLFGEGLGLDSIDALELVLGLEKEFGVIIPDAEVGKKVFQSVRTMAQYVVEHQGTA